jgi:hypothetical protein
MIFLTPEPLVRTGARPFPPPSLCRRIKDDAQLGAIPRARLPNDVPMMSMTIHKAHPAATPAAYDRLVHSDWSVSPGKRWTAIAHRAPRGWRIDSLAQTPPAAAFLDLLFAVPGTLAGFDFPIGLPAASLEKMGIGFCQLLSSPLSDQAQRFLTPVETLRDISAAQPFYRRHPAGGRQADLLRGLGCADFQHLLRACEMKTASRSRAESIFWTVGPKQVGKAALSGWQDVVIPARARGARLWPFDGPLSRLASHALTLAETYPAEAYRHLGMNRIVKKRTQDGRQAAGAVMLAWASRHHVTLPAGIAALISSGFGARDDGEDAFDAIAGLCGMVEVADGRRAEAPDTMAPLAQREGWILGQTDLPVPDLPVPELPVPELAAS